MNVGQQAASPARVHNLRCSRPVRGEKGTGKNPGGSVVPAEREANMAGAGGGRSGVVDRGWLALSAASAPWSNGESSRDRRAQTQ